MSFFPLRYHCTLPLFLLISLDMGSDIWVRPLGYIAPQGVTWMHFANIAEAPRYLRSEDGGSVRIQHTQVARAAKANATRDGYAFAFDEPSSQVVASPARPRRTAAVPAPNLSKCGFTSVRCACCGANICGTKHTCTRCRRVVDEACMQLVELGNELASHTVESHACHFGVHPNRTTDGVCTWCAARVPVSPDPIPKARKFSCAWQLTRPWWGIGNQQHPSRVVKKKNTSDAHMTTSKQTAPIRS